MRLEPIDSVRPAAYNPRITDQARLEIVKLSLRKLGFVLPIYATDSGVIVSGHQRQIAARALGWTEVPVARVSALKPDQERALNLVFNRATNDMDRGRQATPDKLFRAIPGAVMEAARALPDVTGDDRFPCLRLEQVNPKLLASTPGLSEADYQRNTARAAAHYRVLLPLVVGPTGELLNGIGRLRFALERNLETVEVVRVGAEQSEPARWLLNNLSMDFDIKSHFADVLRYHSRRKKMQFFKKTLGRCYTFALTRKSAKTVDLKNPKTRAAWVRQYGTTVLDFGAGNREEIGMVREAGIRGVYFEPYACPREKDDPDLELSRQIAAEFLREVEAGTEFHSIFCSAIFNSIPFQEDRLKVVQILAALAGPHTTLYSHSVSVNSSIGRLVSGQVTFHRVYSKQQNFPIDYEPNIGMTISDRFKVQKYWTAEEYRALFETGFGVVMVGGRSGDVTAICRKPRPVDPARLQEALRFEFDLPYSEGRSLGMADQALAAFDKRLGIKLL